jgi:hypothetical protein
MLSEVVSTYFLFILAANGSDNRLRRTGTIQ